MPQRTEAGNQIIILILNESYFMQKLIACFFILFFAASCKNNSSSSKPGESLDTSAAKFAGVFSDTIPCADCAGIVTTLNIKPDHTYILEEEYLKGKKGNVFYSMGRWIVTDSVLHLNNLTEGTRQFEILSHASIRMLDNEGKSIADSLLNFKLQRSLVPFKPKKSIPVNGLFSATGDTMQITICAMQKTFAAAIAPDVKTMKTEYAKQKSKRDTVMAYVEGHFELRPSLKSSETEDFFVIEKFKKFAPLERCK